MSLCPLLALAALFLAARAGAQPAPPASPVTAIRAARMVDVRKGTVIQDAVVLVQGTRITQAGSGVAVPSGALVVDLGDATLLPGLVDSHTHLLQDYDGWLRGDDPNMILTVATMSPAKRALLGAHNGREDLMVGITTVRDLGNSGRNGDVALRDAVNAGWVVGPRILASTRALSAAGGQFGHVQPAAQSLIDEEYAVVTGVEEARRAVRQALYDGADVIKVIVNTEPRVLTLEEMRTIVGEARRVGRTVAAHAIGDSGTRIAVEAGASSLEHAYTIPDDVLRTMAAKRIFLVPTDFPAAYYVSIGRPSDSAAIAAGVERFTKGSRERLARAMKLGVPIAFGSDAYYRTPGKTRGESSLLPLLAYAEAGMTPMQIIQAATVNGAELAGWGNRIGALEAGKLADVIAVPGDPTRDIAILARGATFVMKGGAVVKRTAASDKGPGQP